MKIFGVTGWKNSGKTGLMERLIAHFTAQGLSVSTLKHTHHASIWKSPARTHTATVWRARKRSCWPRPPASPPYTSCATPPNRDSHS